MRRGIAATAATALVCMMVGLTVQAQEVTFTGEKCPLNIVKVRGSEEEDRYEVELERADFLGTVDGNEVVVRYLEGEEAVYAMASLEDAMMKVPAVSFSDLPSVENWSDVGTGASGDDARKVQQAFADISVLGEDEVDGIFGEGTAAVVSAFQADNKLQPTGTVDVYTWMVLQDVKEASEPLTTAYPPQIDAKEKFAAIYDSVDDPELLESLENPAWAFSYDPFEGTGKLGPEIPVGTFTDESSQIDQLQMDVTAILYVYRDEEGIVNIIPAFKITSAGAYRPYVEGIDLKSGNDVAKLAPLSCDGEVEGTNLTETAIVPIPEEMNLPEGEKILLRIIGANREYEIEYKVERDFTEYTGVTE